MSDENDIGVLYIATGEQYIKEAEISVQSLKRHNDIPAAIRTDNLEEVNENLFEIILPARRTDGDFGDSIISIEDTPFQRTIFLDSDTYVCDNINGLIDALDRFDLLAAHNPGSRNSKKRGGYIADAPDTFPLYNTGVMSFKSNKKVKSLFNDWEKIYEKNKKEIKLNLNQPAFREALYKSDVAIGTIPSEYNLRVHDQGSVGFASDKVRIVHGRHPMGLDVIADHLNKKTGMRVYTSKKWPIEVIGRRPSYRFIVNSFIREEGNEGGLRERFERSVREKGLVKTLWEAFKWKSNSG
ncbi:putative nucleotide-diphospho-sugar transferase [Halopiger aswanensis]|uniref:Nucleotide-diphospho-sugar transferase n=1 Tax=Halopiger aswanensis TaxID=148449 RepID=A0A419WRM4_9EURY|nr:putative nucleotide-diphospho-sugar transferase [Halopiger aswanensis]RKD98095.1 nucleotide-diphospho-sugar transferase [Halopiger aswanensis]